jgi:hypothetical protein
MELRVHGYIVACPELFTEVFNDGKALPPAVNGNQERGKYATFFVTRIVNVNKISRENSKSAFVIVGAILPKNTELSKH